MQYLVSKSYITQLNLIKTRLRLKTFIIKATFFFFGTIETIYTRIISAVKSGKRKQIWYSYLPNRIVEYQQLYNSPRNYQKSDYISK